MGIYDGKDSGNREIKGLAMSNIKSLLNAMLDITRKLAAEHVNQSDEFVAINEIELAVHEARIVFERTKKIDEE